MIEKQLTMEKLLEKIGFINRLYDVVRIVDPIKKQVVDYQNNKLIAIDSRCYGFWERNSICENCTSIYALNQDETYAKIEYNEDRVYMILSMPVQLADQRIVLELLRDITRERILFDSMDKSKNEVYKLLKNRKTNIIKDDLTKIFNNRYINERLPYDIMNSHIQEEYIALLLINIDDFKEVNNKYGHGCGNKILKEFAWILKEQTKSKNKWVARYTADNFIIIMNGYSPQEVSKWAENLKRMIEEYKFVGCEESIDITSSIGIHSVLKADISMMEFIDRAELELCNAKKQGKNRVVSSEGRK